MYEQFGARVDGDKVAFQLFVPNPELFGDPEIETIRVAGDFSTRVPWDLGGLCETLFEEVKSDCRAE